MTHKAHPHGVRLGIVADWQSHWFKKRNIRQYLEQDFAIRNHLTAKIDRVSLEGIHIERSGNSVTVIIHTSRPGLLIGRGGTGILELKNGLEKILKKQFGALPIMRLEVQEVKKPETRAQLVALNIAEQIEKRLPFRRVLKKTIERVRASKDVKGVKISIAGRLDGSEMARRQHLSSGSLPLQSLRAAIDYAYVTAKTTYGIIGIKVWVYKGEVFEDTEAKEMRHT